jgi:hypothetical protein
MADDDIKFETRFSRSRGLFPYVAGLLGAAVLVLAFMYVTGIGRDRLPYSEYFAVRAPSAADGSEALSLETLKTVSDDKMVSIDGTVTNRTEAPISGLVAVIAVNDTFSLPVQTVNAPVDPADLGPKATGMFHAMVPLGEHGLGNYTINFRLPNEGPFVPHKDDRPAEPEPPSEKKPSR